jgi:fimbrial chaperone protein
MEITQLFINWLKKSKLLLVCGISLLFVNAAQATYDFDRTRIVLSKNQPVDSMKFTNPEKDIPINLQMKVLRWTQDKGNDVYQETKDIIVAPPVLKIPVEKSRIVRVGWRVPGPLTQELAYRLIINDLTSYKQELKKEADKPVTTAVQFKLQINMPIFIKPDNPVFQGQWQVKRAGGNQLNVMLTNTGNVHIQVLDVTLTNENNEVIASMPTQFYLLPNQSKQGTLTVTKSPGQLVTVTAKTDNGKLSSIVNVT